MRGHVRRSQLVRARAGELSPYLHRFGAARSGSSGRLRNLRRARDATRRDTEPVARAGAGEDGDARRERVKFGSARGRSLLLLIALLATLVMLGCWDARREMQRVLDQGYATTAQLTGAQFTRLMPIAADGWRPRFIEQDLAVDLSWKGKDGKTYE